jgi:hypothetical protein
MHDCKCVHGLQVVLKLVQEVLRSVCSACGTTIGWQQAAAPLQVPSAFVQCSRMFRAFLCVFSTSTCVLYNSKRRVQGLFARH